MQNEPHYCCGPGGETTTFHCTNSSKGDMRIHIEGAILGSNIHIDGYFDLVIHQGRKNKA